MGLARDSNSDPLLELRREVGSAISKSFLYISNWYFPLDPGISIGALAAEETWEACHDDDGGSGGGRAGGDGGGDGVSEHDDDGADDDDAETLTAILALELEILGGIAVIKS